MGVRLPSVASKVLANAALAGNGEAPVLISPPLNLSIDFEQVLIFCYFNITPGASTTGVTGRIRRGVDATGTLITLANTITVVAANSYQLAMMYIDTPGAAAGVQYTMTGQTIAQTVQATIADGCIIVMAL